ncbi:homoserine O-acetyltransferase family protein [Crocinitomix algicola]|uniref:homoserine O-acetyltransferase family protein n=1 Tax=Crocinitomix algicola TaxID=1740263 RepID=UPI0008722A1A|nr:homoserine O-acetyltransferase [Crocinitomix algicola]
MNQYFTVEKNVELESGQKIENVRIAYRDTGPESGAKVVWVCHALTGDANVFEWWSGLFGCGQLFDPKEYRVISANILGSCYGSTGPQDYDCPNEFPSITIRDIVRFHKILADELGVERISILIGGSIGGQQALEWACIESDRIEQLILIATNAVHSSFGRGFNEVQRLALKADSTFGLVNGGKAGLKAARSMAMISYRSYQDFQLRQKDVDSELESFKAVTYLNYLGEKFVERFHPNAYFILTKAMDSHNVARDRGGIEEVLGRITCKTLVIGVDTDLLFPIEEQQLIANCIPNAEFGVIKSIHGHDAFLIEYEQLNFLIHEYLFNGFKKFKPTTLKKRTNVK